MPRETQAWYNSSTTTSRRFGCRGRAPFSCEQCQCQTIIKPKGRVIIHLPGIDHWTFLPRSFQWVWTSGKGGPYTWTPSLRVRSYRAGRPKKPPAPQSPHGTTRINLAPPVPRRVVWLPMRNIQQRSSLRRRPSAAKRYKLQRYMGFAGDNLERTSPSQFCQ